MFYLYWLTILKNVQWLIIQCKPFKKLLTIYKSMIWLYQPKLSFIVYVDILNIELY